MLQLSRCFFCFFWLGPLHSPEDKESKDMAGTVEFTSTSALSASAGQGRMSCFSVCLVSAEDDTVFMKTWWTQSE